MSTNDIEEQKLDGDLSIAASEGSSVAVGLEEQNDEPKKEEIEEKKEVNSHEEKDEAPSMVKEEVVASNDLAPVKKAGCTKSKILMNVVVPSIFLACVIVAVAVLAVRYKNFKKKYPGCKVDHQNWIANGVCQNEGLKYNIAECQFDGGDCDEFNSMYPNCEVENPTWIGDGKCNGGDYNSDDCAFDGGDCSEFNENYPDCKVEDPSLVGDGNCDGDDYNVEVCGFDGGDCE